MLRRRLNRLKSDDQSAKGCKAPLTLEMMPEKAASDGAVCLDGTPGGFYISLAKNESLKNSWQIYFMGGATKMSCHASKAAAG